MIHLLNYGYRPARDEVCPLPRVKLTLDLNALGLPANSTGRWVTPEATELTVALKAGTVELPALGWWGLLVLQGPP